MKRLITLTFLIFTLSSCSFVNDSKVQDTSVNIASPLSSATNSWTTRKIKNIRKPKTNSWTIDSTGAVIDTNPQTNIANNSTLPTSKNDAIPTWSSIAELSKISISEAIIASSWTTESGWIEDISDEQVGQLVDILLEAGK